MEKIWQQSYPSDVPKDIILDDHTTTTDVMAQACQRFADKPAISNFGQVVTYAQVEQLSHDFAAYMRTQCELSKGDRIAIMMPNLIQYPVLIYSAFLAGLTVVNVNPLYTSRELLHQLNDSGAKIIVVLHNVAHVLEAIIDKTAIQHVITTKLGDCLGFPRSLMVNFVSRYIKKNCPSFSLPGNIPFTHALEKGRHVVLEQVQCSPDDIAFLQYTGGTTAAAKGVMLTHRNMVANIEQSYCWVKNHCKDGQETIITALPMYHIFSLTVNCLTFFKMGAYNIFITNPRDMQSFIKACTNVAFTVITGVNTLFNALLNHPDFAKLDTSKLKLVIGGGMAVQRSIAQRWQEATKTPLYQGYGLTEASPVVTMSPLNQTEFSGSIGLPLSSTLVKVIDEQGHEVALGEPGELCVQGPQVMKGYWNREEETRAVLSEDGWLKTGDIARIDEKGFVYLIDRKKDMINVSGFKVFPNEVENVIAHCEGVLEVAVVGVPDDASGEAVKVFVVSNGTLDKAKLQAYCKDNLTGYKQPKHIEFVQSLPKTNVGKILRKDLRKSA